MTKGKIAEILRKIRKARKVSYQQIAPPKIDDKRILFIVGCQRSGTTLMRNIFELDINARVYGEFGELNIDDLSNIRLRPLPEVKRIFDRHNVNLIVVKPLSESQRIIELLDFFPQSRALWMYRDYREVARSNLKKFGIGNGVSDLRNIVEDGPKEWIYEGIGNSTRRAILQLFDEKMPPNDAAALFWFVRNTLFFSQSVDSDERIQLCRYDALVTNPRETIEGIYKHLGIETAPKIPANFVSPSSVGNATDLALSTEVKNLCRDLMVRLDHAYTIQNAKSGASHLPG